MLLLQGPGVLLPYLDEAATPTSTTGDHATASSLRYPQDSMHDINSCMTDTYCRVLSSDLKALAAQIGPKSVRFKSTKPHTKM